MVCNVCDRLFLLSASIAHDYRMATLEVPSRMSWVSRPGCILVMTRSSGDGQRASRAGRVMVARHLKTGAWVILMGTRPLIPFVVELLSLLCMCQIRDNNCKFQRLDRDITNLHQCWWNPLFLRHRQSGDSALFQWHGLVLRDVVQQPSYERHSWSHSHSDELLVHHREPYGL